MNACQFMMRTMLKNCIFVFAMVSILSVFLFCCGPVAVKTCRRDVPAEQHQQLAEWPEEVVNNQGQDRVRHRRNSHVSSSSFGSMISSILSVVTVPTNSCISSFLACWLQAWALPGIPRIRLTELCARELLQRGANPRQASASKHHDDNWSRSFLSKLKYTMHTCESLIFSSATPLPTYVFTMLCMWRSIFRSIRSWVRDDCNGAHGKFPIIMIDPPHPMPNCLPNCLTLQPYPPSCCQTSLLDSVSLFYEWTNCGRWTGFWIALWFAA